LVTATCWGRAVGFEVGSIPGEERTFRRAQKKIFIRQFLRQLRYFACTGQTRVQPKRRASTGRSRVERATPAALPPSWRGEAATRGWTWLTSNIHDGDEVGMTDFVTSDQFDVQFVF
jgi:hypothetical protein